MISFSPELLKCLKVQYSSQTEASYLTTRPSTYHLHTDASIMSLRPSLQPLLATTSRYASTSTSRLPAATAASAVASSSASSSASAPTDRVYTERKTYLYNYYAHLLETSQLVLMFQHANLSVADLSKIRRGIAKIPPPPDCDPASITVLRTGLLAALTRHQYQLIPFPKSKLKGQTALIASPTLSPRYISQILTSINRSIKQSQREGGSKDQEVKQPELRLSFGFLEKGNILSVQEVEQVAKLPELDGLRSQLVGLLEMRGRELVGVLGQAGGGGLVRTLQGLENGLKEKAGGAGDEAQA